MHHWVSIWPKKRLTLIAQIHNMLSGVCSGSNHKHHQIQFITIIENHNKALRNYRETVNNNHEHSESTSKFISLYSIVLLATSIQGSTCFSFSRRFSATSGKPFSNRIIEPKSLTYFGCWRLSFTNNIPRIASKDHRIFWKALMVGVERTDTVVISRCMRIGTIMQSSTIDVMKHWVKRTIRNEMLLSKMVYIYYTVSKYRLIGYICPWYDIPLHHIALHVWLKHLPSSIELLCRAQHT